MPRDPRISLGRGTVLLTNLPQFAGGDGGRFFDEHHTLLSGTNYLAQLYAGREETSLVSVGSPIFYYSDQFAGYFGGLADQIDIEIPFIEDKASA